MFDRVLNTPQEYANMWGTLPICLHSPLFLNILRSVIGTENLELFSLRELKKGIG